MVICLERSADLHRAQLMPLPLTVSCFSKIRMGFTFLVPAHPGSPGRVCVCVTVDVLSTASAPGRDLAAAASKLESEAGTEVSRGEDMRQIELKSPNLRSNQIEARNEVGLVRIPSLLSEVEISFL